MYVKQENMEIKELEIIVFEVLIQGRSLDVGGANLGNCLGKHPICFAGQ
jgi:hypothetical protein